MTNCVMTCSSHKEQQGLQQLKLQKRCNVLLLELNKILTLFVQNAPAEIMLQQFTFTTSICIPLTCSSLPIAAEESTRFFSTFSRRISVSAPHIVPVSTTCSKAQTSHLHSFSSLFLNIQAHQSPSQIFYPKIYSMKVMVEQQDCCLSKTDTATTNSFMYVLLTVDFYPQLAILYSECFSCCAVTLNTVPQNFKCSKSVSPYKMNAYIKKRKSLTNLQ